MKSTKKFAIAGTTAIGGTVYWTGAKRRPWTTMESGAKSWSERETAEGWLSRAPVNAVDNLRVLEVAP